MQRLLTTSSDTNICPLFIRGLFWTLTWDKGIWWDFFVEPAKPRAAIASDHEIRRLICRMKEPK